MRPIDHPGIPAILPFPAPVAEATDRLGVVVPASDDDTVVAMDFYDAMQAPNVLVRRDESAFPLPNGALIVVCFRPSCGQLTRFTATT